MKTSVKYLFIAALAVTVFSCKKDNYDAPSATLSGHLLYQSDTIYLEKEQVPVLVYQYGFGKVGPIGSVSGGLTNVTPTFAQDGGYSLLLFNGDYKIVIPNGQGPFLWKQTAAGNPDTVSVTLNGSQTVDLQVTPYYLIQAAQINAAGTDSVHATFSVQKVITDANAKDIEYVALYVNKTQFVSGGNNINTSPASIAGVDISDMSSIQLGAHYKNLIPTQDYVFARLGIKIVGVEDLIFSPLIKVSL